MCVSVDIKENMVKHNFHPQQKAEWGHGITKALTYSPLYLYPPRHSFLGGHEGQKRDNMFSKGTMGSEATARQWIPGCCIEGRSNVSEERKQWSCLCMGRKAGVRLVQANPGPGTSSWERENPPRAGHSTPESQPSSWSVVVNTCHWSSGPPLGLRRGKLVSQLAVRSPACFSA